MGLFINGVGVISPQPSLQAVVEGHAQTFQGNRLACQEPDYSAYLDPRQSRRMSRIVKMGAAASLQALSEAGLETIDGVIAGTGLGCLEDTSSFLTKMVQNDEEMLSPTAFIHSTHNTIASQVAYLLKCRGYNSTYVHRNISFESALIDALSLAGEGLARNLLVGGVDELTDLSFDIMYRLGLFKESDAVSSDTLYNSHSRGSIAGEGSTFFVLGEQAGANAYAQLLDVKTVSFGNVQDAGVAAKEMLGKHGLDTIDLLMTGHNGDMANDRACDAFSKEIGVAAPIRFKHLCGEYTTASGFALGLAATTLKQGKAGQTLLIFNRYQLAHQSLMLLKAC